MADRTEILNEIDALSSHCRVPLMSVEQRTGWMRDWCEDLGQFRIEDIRRAFRDWRQSGNTKFPTPGQVMPILRRLNDVGAPEAKLVSWRELSDPEYAALSLSEKVRHHLILANKAEVAAGPMWRHGKHASDMPDEWHGQRQRAENHRAEAKRLRDLMNRQDMSA